MLSKAFKILLGFATMAVCLTAVTGSVRPTELEEIRMSGSITVVTRNSPTTYFEDRSGIAGYEYELANDFADFLGVDLKIEVADSLNDIFRQLKSNNASFAAAGLTITEERQRWFRFATPYQKVNELVVYRRGTQKPRKLEDLLGKMLVVTSGSSHSETLKNIQENTLPELSWSETDELDTTDLLHRVETGEITFTIIDSNEFAALQAYFPRLGTGIVLGEDRQISWAFEHNRDPSLVNAVNEFFALQTTRQKLAQLGERYYGHLAELDYVGAKRFSRQIGRKLDRYKKHFQQASEATGFDWRLLAAVGYQESHWNPLATSFTGVRGLMMLTRDTAKDLGVTDRLDPEQSIEGGSRYLAILKKRLGDQIPEPDRTWLTMASYNIGYGHLQDARRLAYEMGGNPNLWKDVKEALPLLSQKKYHRNTRYGYARGREAVDYVQNIRRYYDVLVWNEEQQTRIAQQQEEKLHLSSSLTIIPPLL
ncbi:MAG: membrane-bound lytic murein transglycosylase MltF [Oceanospirillaceae bacterium]|nr:membrane-bound lytic murein transglycosylase MltF [Oceanospirillaceae bacterium]